MPQGDRRGRDPGHGPLSRARRPGRGRRACVVLLSGSLVAAGGRGLAAASEEPAEPPPARSSEPEAADPALARAPRLGESVTVTATRRENRLAEVPAAISVSSEAALRATAAPTLDDALRQVPGFSLFRRSGSRFANPTAQSVSLRGLGASGASRALVLADGVPLHDAFGGWVQWGRLPRAAVERIELLRGGVSDLYGTSALGGVVQILTRRPGDGTRLSGEASVGGSGSLDATATATASRGPWSTRASAEAYRTDGYRAVVAQQRGAIDTELASRRVAGDLLAERRLGESRRISGRLTLFGEERRNGTPQQVNDTRVLAGSFGWDSGGPAAVLQLRAWGQLQTYHQAFSAVSADRSREDLTRLQTVPSSALGLSVLRSRTLGSRHRALLGVEFRQVDGVTREDAFTQGVAVAQTEAGGIERGAAVFAEDLFQAHPRLLIAASLRLDGWWHSAGRETTTAASTGDSSRVAFDARRERAWSPRAAVLWRASRGVSLTASGYGAFRAPTLNELYRSFRLGNTVTLANPELRAERLSGGEAGALLERGSLALRLTGFVSRVRDGVANVTVGVTPALVTRQRRNLGALRSQGAEVEADLGLGPRSRLSAAYAFTDSRVNAFAAEPSLVGLRVPQVARHQFTAQARSQGTAWLVSVQARWTGGVFEDDRNQALLEGGWQLDALAERRLTARLRGFVAVENLLNEALPVARTPVTTVVAPRSVRAGVRLGR